MIIPVNAGGEANIDAVRSQIEHQPYVNKASGACVESNLFLIDGCSDVSALLFSPYHIANVCQLGFFKDLELISNGFACNKLSLDFLEGIKRIWVEIDYEKGQYCVQSQ